MARDRDEKGGAKDDLKHPDKDATARARGCRGDDGVDGANAPAPPALPYDAWRLVELLFQSVTIRTIMLYGPPGTGKTYAALRVGRTGAGVFMVTLTEETSAAELRGHFIFKGGRAEWHHGPFVRAMLAGARLVINEISNASPDVLALLFPILESWETAVLTLPSGETVRPAPGFHVVVTDNKPPDQLPEALRDRFQAVIEVLEPHPGALAALRPAFRNLAEKALRFPEGRRISARAWKNLELLVDDFGLEIACLVTFGPERGQMLFDAIQLALDPDDDLRRAVGRDGDGDGKRDGHEDDAPADDSADRPEDDREDD
jgi:hypothetical protein